METIVARAEGNPLFLRSLLASARSGADLDGLPETIEGLVTVEIDRLSPTHRRVLRYAAVLGTTVDEDLLARMLGDDWIEPASPTFAPLHAFLAPGRSGQLQFRTALIRDVAYQGLPFRRRRSLHEQAGAALLTRAARSSEQEVERLARHFHLAEDAASSWRYSRIAAERARMSVCARRGQQVPVVGGSGRAATSTLAPGNVLRWSSPWATPSSFSGSAPLPARPTSRQSEAWLVTRYERRPCS